MSKLLNPKDYKGIYFSHNPKCGGTYIAAHLGSLCEQAGLNFIDAGHQWQFGHGPNPKPARDGKIYRDVPENYLKISSVRHPLTLLSSLYFHADNGYANLRKYFSSFEEFVLHFCLISNFEQVTDGGDVWTYVREMAMYCVDDNDESISAPQPLATACESGQSRQRQIMYLAVRPLAFFRCRFGLGDKMRNLITSLYDHASVNNYFPHPAYPDIVRRQVGPSQFDTWPSRAQTGHEFMLQQGIIRDMQAFPTSLSVEGMRRFWYFTGFLWNPLFDYRTGTALPDLILRLENIDDGIDFLYDFFGIWKDDQSDNYNKNAGIQHDYNEIYSEDMKYLIEATQALAMHTFGYGMNDYTIHDNCPIIFGKDLHVDFLPPIGTLLDLKWEL